MAAPLPSTAAIAKLIGTLVGVPPKIGHAPPLSAHHTHAVATYIDATRRILYAGIADVAFIASAGAALALIPAGNAVECIKAGKASDAMTENAQEVLNVGAALFNEIEGTTLHVKLDRLAPMDKLSAPLTAALARPTARLDLLVSLPGYPDGKLTFVAIC